MLNLTSSAAKSAVAETRRAGVSSRWSRRGARLIEGKGGGGARAVQSRRLVGCGESGGRNGRKAGRATAESCVCVWGGGMAVTAPEGVSAVWV